VFNSGLDIRKLREILFIAQVKSIKLTSPHQEAGICIGNTPHTCKWLQQWKSATYIYKYVHKSFRSLWTGRGIFPPSGNTPKFTRHALFYDLFLPLYILFPFLNFY
jgi:hypothetical protein